MVVAREKLLLPPTRASENAFRNLLGFLRGIDYSALSQYQRIALGELVWGLEFVVADLLLNGDANYDYIVRLV